MPIRIEYNPDPTYLARAAQVYGRATGMEEQRRQQVTEAQRAQAQALDQLNSDRSYEINRATLEQRDRLEAARNQNALEQIAAQEQVYNRAAFRDERIARRGAMQDAAIQGAAEDAELIRRMEEAQYSRLSPQGQREVMAIRTNLRNAMLRPENQAPEAMQILQGEAQQRIQAIMQSDIRSNAPDPQAELGQSFAIDPSGQSWVRKPDGGWQLGPQFENTPEGFEADQRRQQQEADDKLTLQMIEASMVESVSDNDTATTRFDRERFNQIRLAMEEARRARGGGGAATPQATPPAQLPATRILSPGDPDFDQGAASLGLRQVATPQGVVAVLPTDNLSTAKQRAAAALGLSPSTTLTPELLQTLETLVQAQMGAQ